MYTQITLICEPGGHVGFKMNADSLENIVA